MSMFESQKPLLIPMSLYNGPELHNYGYKMIAVTGF